MHHLNDFGASNVSHAWLKGFALDWLTRSNLAKLENIKT
jgi:hypothetical protein